MLEALDTAVEQNIEIIGAAGVVIIGVVLAIRAVDWLKLVLIEREATREAMERDRDRY